MPTVFYIGVAETMVVTTNEFVDGGVVDQTTVLFSEDTGDQALVSTAAAAYLATFPEFTMEGEPLPPPSGTHPDLSAHNILGLATQSELDAHASGPHGGSSIRVEDEGGTIVAGATGVNFAGAGVTVTNSGSNEALVTIPGGSGVRVEDEGTSIVAAATGVNFSGAGVTVTNAGSNEATVTIPGGGSGVRVEDEGGTIIAAASGINFVGAGVTVTDAGSSEATVTIPGGGGGISGVRVEDEGGTIVAAATGINFAGSGVVVTDAGSNEATVTINAGSVPDATTSVKGIVKLANHLGGTADLPVVHAAVDVFPVEAYGAVGTAVWDNGQADASTAIEAAIAAAKANGGGVVLFRALNYRVSRTIVIDGDDIVLATASGVHSVWMFDITKPGACVIRMLATGPVTGPVLDFTNGSLGRRLFGVGLRGLTIDTGAATGFDASIGVRLRSVACGHWNFAVVRVGAGKVGLDLACDPFLAAGAGDNQENIFENVTVLALTGAHTGKCIRLGGYMNTLTTGSNTSTNWWGLVTCTYSNGGGLDLVNADTEYFSRLRMFRHVGAIGAGVIFRSDPTGGHSLARNNTMDFIQPGGGGVVFESGAAGAFAPYENVILSYSIGNSSGGATWGAGAKGSVTYQNGVQEVDGVEIATPIQSQENITFSKLPMVMGNRAGMNTRVYSNGLWTEGALQYAAMVARANITSPAVPTFTLLNTETAGASTPLTLTRASTPAEGTPIVAVVSVDGATDTSTVTPPSGDGWELKAAKINSGNVGVWVFEKVFTTFKGTVGPWTFSRSDTGLVAEGHLLAFPGGSPGSLAWDPAGEVSGSGTAVALPVITTLVDNSLLVSVVASAVANSVTTDGAYTERTDAGAGGPSLSVATKSQATAGASAAASHTLANTGAFVGLHFVIPPATSEDRPFIARRTLPNGDWSTAQDLTLVASNLLQKIDLDEHNMLSVAVGPDGRVYVVGNMHSEPGASPALRAIRTTATDGSISGTWEAVTISGMNGSLTYPQMIRVTNGELLLFGRHTVSGASSGVLKYARLASNGTWGAAVTLIDGLSQVKNPYWHPVVQQPSDLNHIPIFFAWRISGADNGPLCYFESLDGGVTWKKSDGTTLTLPVIHTAELTSSTRNAEVVDAAVDILNQDGACISTTGVPQAVYKKNNAGGSKRLYHAYRTGTTWFKREMPAFTLEWQRGHLFPAPGGRVFALGNGYAKGFKNEARLLEVTPALTSFSSKPFARWDLGNSELPIDIRDAIINKRLTVLITGSESMFVTEYQDDLQWNLQTGYVLSLPGVALSDIQKGLAGQVVDVEVIGSQRLEIPVRVTAKLPTMQTVGARLELDQTWAGSDLMVRVRCRGLSSSNRGVMLVSLLEQLDPSTQTEKARMTFTSTTEDGHETPWVPLNASGEGYVQLQAALQTTSPAITSGPGAGDSAYGRITSATIEIGKVRF